jgi:hypothetical protein
MSQCFAVLDVLSTTQTADIARKAIAVAVRDGLLNTAQTSGLRKFINRAAHGLAPSTKSNKVNVTESTTS